MNKSSKFSLTFTATLVGAAFVGIAMFGASPSQAQSRDAASGGYDGGVPFREDCGSRLMTGVRIWQGDVVDAIMPLCGEFDTLGHQINFNVFPGSRFGGFGGNEKQVQCPQHATIRGLKVTVQNGTVANVHLLCRNLKSGEYTEAGTGWQLRSGGGVATDIARAFAQFEGQRTVIQAGQFEGQNFNCRDDESGYGLYGRSGGLVDAVGLTCLKRRFGIPVAPAGQPGAVNVGTPTVQQGPARIRRVGKAKP